MTVSLETLTALVDDAVAARVSAEGDLSKAEREVEAMKQRVAELVFEEDALRTVLARRYPEAAQVTIPPAEPEPTPDLLIDGARWADLPRTEAVERAIQMIGETKPSVSPGDIEAFLAERGRRDDRDAIGGATAHLNRTHKIHSLGRGKWVHGPGPVQTTPVDGVGAPSTGSIPTQRPGGDGHAAGPDVVPDHREAFSGRNTGDHDRETDDRVGGIQF